MIKRLSVLVALALCVTIGGVYATWTYTQSTDVMDESVNISLNLGNVTAIGTYGTYEVDQSGLTLTIEPKAGTTHTTSLNIAGELVIKFTPNAYAPEPVKENAVASTYVFSLANVNWQYEGQNIVTLPHAESHNIVWVKQGDGSFKYTLDANAIAGHIDLTEFTLDTKVKYDAYNAVLGQGSVVVTVSDGVNAGASN